ncbi:MAG: SLBB domain-containing protein, partial [Chitinispirillales bacterium]|nr:SLBB domain-containing protein [Chitinispirillales bacterium]
MKLLKRLLIIAAVAAAPARICAQSVVSPELLRQLKNDKSASEQANRFLQAHPAQRDSLLRRASSRSDSVGGLFRDTLDFGMAADSSLLAPDTSWQGFSVYEEMFLGRDIFPDSLIPFLRPYGYDVFLRGARRLDFGPGEMGGAPADYPIRAGDEVKVQLWGRINEEYTLTVSREGAVAIPHNVGPVAVAGLTYGGMQRAVADKLKNIEGVNVSISMGELRPIGVYIVGEVNSPGFHTVSPLTSVTNALFAAGGVAKRGSLRNVRLKRGGRVVAEIDFYDCLMSGSGESGLRLQHGDVISVPIAKQMVGVAGNVRRSALYELKNPTKLIDALDLAGGVSPAGWMGRVQVERFEGNSHRTVLDADASKPLPEFLVKDGDLIKVFPVLSRDKNTVFLSGNVLRPGKYAYKAGMRVRDVIGGYEELLPETHFGYAVILRKTYPSYLNRIVPFSLEKALADEASGDNAPLEERDEIIVYSSDHFNPDRSVTIEGAVTSPGAYKLLENMTVRDLILQAGGLSDDASKERGELYRRRFEGESVITTKVEFGIGKAMAGDTGQNALLARNDKVFIRSMKGYEPERSVRLGGQVNYPGAYVIFEGETLGDLITRAGGFKPDAYLPAAIFTRQSVKAMEESRVKLYNNELGADMIRLSMQLASKGINASPLLEQQALLKGMMDSVTVLGRVMIDMTDEAQYKPFALEGGDELFVPRNLSTVSVLGDVYNSGTFRFNPQRPSAAHYLEIAGGPKETANKKAVY